MRGKWWVPALLMAWPALHAQALKDFSIEPVEATGSYANTLRSNEVNANRVSLRDLIAFLYGMPAVRVTGPDWLEERYRVTAKAGQEQDEFVPALRKAVTERLHLRVEHATKELPVYVVRQVSPNSSKMRTGTGKSHVSGSNGSLEAESMSPAHFEEILTRVLDRPVVDETGLEGGYTFRLTWEAGNLDSLKQAMRDQLGLAVSEERRSMEVLAVGKE